MSEEIAILSRLRAPEGAVRNKKRVGRGIGSGIGKTSGRGMKGQKARQPGNIHKLHFEGGQMPLNRRLPKVGFNSLNPTNYAPVNVAALNVFDNGATVDEKTLPSDVAPWFRNLNDGTSEGIRHTSAPFSSVQFHPEAAAGPRDTAYLFDDFLSTVAACKGTRP